MKKILVFVLVLCSLLLCFTACGEEGGTRDSDGYVIWEISDDLLTLTGDSRTYHRYIDLPIDMDLKGGVFYENSVETKEYETLTVYSPSLESGIKYLWSYQNGYTVYIESDEDKAIIDSFIAGGFKKSRLVNSDYNEARVMEIGFAEKLDALSGEKLTVAVRELYNADCYDVKYYCEEDTLFRIHGAIYIYEGDPYYINYDKLDNSYFDSYGAFSFRRGSVDMYKLDEECTEIFTRHKHNMSHYSEYYTYEWELNDGGEYETSREEAIATIVTTVTLLGIIPPIIPIAIYSVRMFILKRKRDLPTLIIISAAAVWLISGIILLILAL